MYQMKCTSTTQYLYRGET